MDFIRPKNDHIKDANKDVCTRNDNETINPQSTGYCYIYSFLLFVWLFFFAYALFAVVYVSHVENRFFNTPRL
jgi:hypothetical protein